LLKKSQFWSRSQLIYMIPMVNPGLQVIEEFLRQLQLKMNSGLLSNLKSNLRFDGSVSSVAPSAPSLPTVGLDKRLKG
jgi:hypothetical protein